MRSSVRMGPSHNVHVFVWNTGKYSVHVDTGAHIMVLGLAAANDLTAYC